MTDVEFYETAIHTDVGQVRDLDDKTAGQFLLKMAAMNSGITGTQITVRFGVGDLVLYADTPCGTYSFILSSEADDAVLEVDQVL